MSRKIHNIRQNTLINLSEHYFSYIFCDRFHSYHIGVLARFLRYSYSSLYLNEPPMNGNLTVGVIYCFSLAISIVGAMLVGLIDVAYFLMELVK